MKRILIFSLVYYPRFVGGAEVAVKEITDRLGPDSFSAEGGPAFGWDMVTLRAGMSRSEKIGNVTIHRTIPKFVPISVAKHLFPFFAFWKACSLHRKNRYDAVWSIMANYAGFGALFFKLVHPNVPFVLTLQEGDPIPYIKKRVGVLYPLFKRIFTKADTVTAISTYLADWAREMGAKRVEVVPNGVDGSKFKVESVKLKVEERERVRRELGFGKEDTLLITTSRLVEKNAVGDIIAALQYLPENVKLLIIGVGSLESNLKLKTKNLQLESRVRFLGFLSHDEIPSYLWASDIFIRPSLSEGMGNSFIEAMAASLPVIATPVGGIVDFLKDGETGLFCEVRNPKSIAQKVEKLMKDAESRDYIIRTAQKMASEKYDWNLIAEKMKEVLRRA